MRRVAVAVFCGFGLAAHAAPDGLPAPGQHPAQLCVQVLEVQAEANCGPADAWVGRGKRLQLRISDIVYRFELHSSQVDVVLMHGSMQIDGFTAFYEWQGSTLQFLDLEKRTRYEVQFNPRARGTR
jgi:hypothetical protein